MVGVLKRLSVVVAIIMVVAGLAGVQIVSAASSGLWVVNSVGDEPDANLADGQCATAVNTCTLRAAIQNANYRRGADTIRFNIAGSGVHTITFTNTLPVIDDTSGPLLIDGYSQPGASVNTAARGSNASIMIELVGPVNDKTIRITSPENEIRGLAIYGTFSAIVIEGTGAGGNRIVGNFLGTNAAGTYENPNGNGTGMGLSIEGALKNVIGSPALADRNVISGNGGPGIRINQNTARGNLVQNNVVGLNPSLTDNLSQWNGIDIQWWAHHNLIGGYGANEGNLISGHTERSGVEFSHQTIANQVIGNRIGTLGDGNSVAAFTKNNWGVAIKDGPYDNYIADNVIAGNNFGVWSKHNYIPQNYVVNNRIGVASDGSPLPNGVNIYMSGLDYVYYGNVLGANETQVQVTNYVGDESYFGAPAITSGDAFRQSQFIGVPPVTPSGGQTPTLTNLALQGTASQISTTYSGAAPRAIDGNTDGVYRSGSTTSTGNVAQAWWQVDLGAVRDLDHVVLYNRTDCCATRLSNFSVFVSDSPFGDRTYADLAADTAIKQIEVASLNGQPSISLNVGRTGRYVRVQLSGTNYLSLAEVEVYGYGPQTSADPLIPSAATPLIDIIPVGSLNPNDPGDADAGVQGELNWPELTGLGPGRVFGTACPGCKVEVYTSGVLTNGVIDTTAAGVGVGLAWIGTARADGTGAWSLADARLAAGRQMSALAIDMSGNTSELPVGYLIPDTHYGVDGSAAASIGPAAPPAVPPLPTPWVSNLNADIEGTVSDSAGVGVSGVEVKIYTSDRTALVSSAVTMSGGTYSVRVPDGCYALTFVAPDGYQFPTGQMMLADTCVDPDSTATVNAGIQAIAAASENIDAVVVDSNGLPVAGVWADLFNSNTAGDRLGYLRSMATGTDGTATFALTEPGCRVITFSLPEGQVFEQTNSRWVNRHVCVAANETATVTATVEVEVTQTQSIEGTVADGAGAGVAGVAVNVYDADRTAVIATATTVADGTYSVALDSAGCFALTFVAPAGYEFAAGSTFDVENRCVAAGATTTVDAVIQPVVTTQSIEGTVADGAGVGVAGVEVNVYDADRTAVIATTTTAADGTYSVALDSAGCYALTLVAPTGYEFATGQFHNADTCVEADGTSTVNATLAAINQVAQGIKALVVDSNGEPVAGVWADLFNSNANGDRLSYLRSLQTGADGTATFSVDAAACRVVTFHLPQGQVFVETNSRWLNRAACVSAGQLVTLAATLKVDPVGPPTVQTIGGTVTKTSGATVAGVEVNLYDANRTTLIASTTTASNGTYSIPVDVGCYALTFVAPTGYEFTTGQFHNADTCVAANGTATVNATVQAVAPASENLVAKVVDSNGEPVQGVWADLFSSNTGGDRLGYLRSLQTGTDGTARFSLGGAACRVVTFHLADGQVFEESNSRWLNRAACVGANETVTVSATLKVDPVNPGPVQSVSGTISQGTSPAAGVNVNLFTAAADGSRGTYLANAVSDSAGLFSLQLSDAGCYVLTYIAPAGKTWAANNSQWYNRSVCVAVGDTVTIPSQSFN